MTHLSTSQPLVSCIMPTYNRREFVPLSIRYFQRQDYDNKELIIIDDGTDDISDLVPADERIHYHRLNEKKTLGAKLNMACEFAQGTVIANWDDDDWYAPRRLSYQIGAFMREGTNVCGLNDLLYFDVRTARAHQYVYPSNQRLWLLGSSLCYTKNHWEKNPFANINVGMDGYFVWATSREEITVLKDSTFAVFMVHEHNVSPKDTSGIWWRPYPAEAIRRVLGADWHCYQPHRSTDVGVSESVEVPTEKTAVIKPVRNIFACLVHENQECVIDLVRNLRFHDPSSIILLYNGGKDPTLLNNHFPFEQYSAVVHPSPCPMKWGRLHDFALDCMQFALDNFSFDTLTIVDSDQLGVGSGLSNYLGQFLCGQSEVGMLGNAPNPQGTTTTIDPVVHALKEIDLWRPFLRSFPQGEDQFVFWTFWPSTVFLADAARDLTRLFATDDTLRDIMQRSRIWATEEVILPTLAALLGYKIVKNPCSYDYVKYQSHYTIGHIDSAFTREDVFWVHPVPRHYEDDLRRHIRVKFNHYESASSVGDVMTISDIDSDFELLLTTPILKAMNKVEGWLEEEEADLLIAVSRKALNELPQPHAIVEVGSYHGRSTIVLGSVVKAVCSKAKVYAIDPHNGKIGAIDQGIRLVPSSFEFLKGNLENAGLVDVVDIIRSYSVDMPWKKPISLLLIDGLHDYPNVARDFYHFEPWVTAGGYIGFHDYADYFPGVKAFVNEIMGSGRYRKVYCAGSFFVLQKLGDNKLSPFVKPLSNTKYFQEREN